MFVHDYRKHVLVVRSQSILQVWMKCGLISVLANKVAMLLSQWRKTVANFLKLWVLFQWS